MVVLVGEQGFVQALHESGLVGPAWVGGDEVGDFGGGGGAGGEQAVVEDELAGQRVGHVGDGGVGLRPLAGAHPVEHGLRPCGGGEQQGGKQQQ